MTSFMISSVPPPMRCRRASRNARADRRLLEVAGAAEHLQARVDEAVLHLRAVLLRHRDLGDRVLVVHHAPRGRVEQRRAPLRARSRRRRACARSPGAPRSAGRTSSRSRAYAIVSSSTCAAWPTRRRRAREPLVLQLPHQLREALARVRAPMRSACGTRDVVERDLRGVATSASRASRAGATPRRPGSDVSTMNSEMPRCPASGSVLRDEREEVRARAVGDEHLAAVDAPHVAVAHGARADRGDVGARVGLGDRDRADLLARDRGPQPALALVVGAELARARASPCRSAPRSPSGSRPRRSGPAPRRTRARRRGRRRCRPSARGSGGRGSPSSPHRRNSASGK